MLEAHKPTNNVYQFRKSVAILYFHSDLKKKKTIIIKYFRSQTRTPSRVRPAALVPSRVPIYTYTLQVI